MCSIFGKHHHLNPNSVTGSRLNNCSLSLEVSSKGHMDPEIATPQQFCGFSGVQMASLDVVPMRWENPGTIQVSHWMDLCAFTCLWDSGIAGFEGTRSRAEETFISVLVRNHSFHWVDSWEMTVQVVTIHKTYHSAKSIQKQGCIPTSGPVDSMELHQCIRVFRASTIPVFCWRLILVPFEFIVFYDTLTCFCALLLRFGIHVPNANSQKSETSFFKIQFSSHSIAKHQLFSINQSSTNVVTPHPKTVGPGAAM